MNRKFTLLLLLSALIVSTAFTQDDDVSSPRVKPTDMFEVGITPGAMFVAGEISPEIGYGVGLHIRKSLDYVFSLRVDGHYGLTSGLNPDTKQNREFEMTWLSGTVFGVFTLNNFRFRRSIKKTNIYAMVGGGANFYESEALAETNYAGGVTIRTGGQERQQVITETALAPHLAAGAGIAFRVSPRFNAGLEYQVFGLVGIRNDLMDGIRLEGDQTSAFIDILNFVGINLNFNIGNTAVRSEPLYWVFPTDEVLAAVDEQVRKRTDEALADSDNDGVIDAIDQEPNTPPDVPVDTKGRTLDSDRDGVPDYKDKEPYYPPRAGEMVNEDGVVTNPIGGTGGGVTEERVQEMIDEAFERYGNLDNKSSMEDWFLPMIHFPLESATIKYSDYGTLAGIGRMLQSNPQLRLVIQGHADQTGAETFNEVLSYRRSMAVVDHLMNNYGVGRGRLIIQFKGADDSLVPLNSSYMNRRVEFRVAGPEDVEMDPPTGYDKNESGNGGY